MRGNNLANHQFMVSDSIVPYLSSPSDISPAQQWTPPAIQEITTDDWGTSRRDVVSRPLFSSPTMEGTSAARDSGGSTSSRSDSSCDYEPMVKSHTSHHCNFTTRRSFMSKPIHPLSFPSETTPTTESTTPQRDNNRHHLSSASGSPDLTELLEDGSHTPLEYSRCRLCERLLSQRSPWSSSRIVKTGDMPVAGVLSCRHVFHAECLEQTTPKTRKNDPPCPICAKNSNEEQNSPDPRGFSKLKSNFPRLRPFSEDGGPSKPWGCAHIPTRNTLMSLNRSRFRKNLSLKDDMGRKCGSFSSQLFVGSFENGAAGSSKMKDCSSSN